MADERHRAAGRELAKEVERAGGRLRLSTEAVKRLFGTSHLRSDEGRTVAAALEDAGLRSDPELPVSREPEYVVFYDRSTQGAPPQPPVVPPPVEAPTPIKPPDLTGTLVAQSAGLPTGALMAGAAAPAVFWAVVGAGIYWPLVLLAVLGGTGAWLLARTARTLATSMFLLPLRSRTWQAVALTALPSLLLTTGLLALVGWPLASAHASRERQDRAAEHVRLGQAALAAGDLERARSELDRATREKSDADGADELEQDINNRERERREERERADAYQRAKQLLKDGRAEAALTAFAALASYRDSERWANRARRAYGAQQLRRARAMLSDGDPKAARRLALASNETYSTSRARSLAREALAQIRARRAAARDRRIARERARAERARQREAAREAERLRQEQELQEPSTPSAPSGGSCADTPGANIPVEPGDPRDRDGDGIACES